MKFDLRLIYIFYFVLFVFLLTFHDLVGFSSNHVSVVIYGLFVLLISLFARYLDIIDIWIAPVSRGVKIAKWILLGLLFVTLGFLAPNINSLFLGGLLMLGLFGRYNTYVFTLSGGMLLGIAFLLQVFFSGGAISYFLYYGGLLLLIGYVYSLPIGQIKISNHRISHLPIIFQESLEAVFSRLQYVIFLFFLLSWYYPALTDALYLFLFLHVSLIFFMKKRRIDWCLSKSLLDTTFSTMGALLSVTIITMIPIFDLYMQVENGREYLILVVGLFLLLCILISLHLSQGLTYIKNNFLNYVYLFIGAQILLNVLLYSYSQYHFEYQDEIDISGIENALPYESTLLKSNTIEDSDEVKTMFDALDEAEKEVMVTSTGTETGSGGEFPQTTFSGGIKKVSGVTTTPPPELQPQENSPENGNGKNLDLPLSPKNIEQNYDEEKLF